MVIEITTKIFLFSKNYTGEKPDLFSRIIDSAGDENTFEILTFERVEKEGVNTFDGYKELIIFLYREEFDFLYLFNSYGMNILFPLLSKILGFKLIYAPHCLGIHRLQSKSKNYMKMIMTYPFLKRSYIRCISRWEEMKYASSRFLDDQKIFYAPYGIDISEFSEIKPGFGSKNVFSLSNARRFKDIETQIKAINEVVEKYPGVHLNIIGGWEDRDYREEIESLIEGLGIEENVSVHGYVEREKMLETMSESEVFVHTSKFETQGLAIYEAAAAGFPICVSDVPVHDQNFERFKHPQGDHEALAKDIKSIFEMDEKDKQEISRDMKELAKDFSYEREMERIKEFFKELDSYT